MSPFDRVTAALLDFKRTGRDRGMARCPAHGGGKERTRSLSVREGEGGAVLVHCFAGCEVGAVVSALGLRLEDLFPPRPRAPGAGRQADPRPFTAREVLAALRSELNVVWVLLSDVANGRELDASMRRRAGVARERCLAAIEELDLAR
jgi:hypothetical protein